MTTRLAAPRFPQDFAAPPDGGAPLSLRALAGACGMAVVVVPSGQQMWLAVSHDAVADILVNAHFNRRSVRERHTLVGKDITCVNDSLLRVDDRRHIVLRRVLSRPLTATSAAVTFKSFENACLRRAAECVELGQVDLVTMYASPVSAAFTASVLGLAPNEVEPLSRLARIHSNLASSPQGVEAATAALLQAARRAMSGLDRPQSSALLGCLADACREGEITPAEARDTGALLTILATDALAAPITAAAIALLDDPKLLERCRVDDGAWHSVALEACRFANNALGEFPRVASREVVVGGQRVRTGESVITSTLGASWDPAVVDEPERFTIGRLGNPYLAFGRGRRACVARGVVTNGVAFALRALFAPPVPVSRIRAHAASPWWEQAPQSVWAEFG